MPLDPKQHLSKIIWETKTKSFYIHLIAQSILGFGFFFYKVLTMAKGKYSRLHGKKWSTITLVLFMLFMLSLVLLMLLALGIVSLPISSDDSPPNDLSSFRRRIVTKYGVRPIWWFYVLWVSDSQCVFDLWVKIDFFFFKFLFGRSKGLGERKEQWTEILSWEPRAFIYHNFLVCKILCTFFGGSFLIWD